MKRAEAGALLGGRTPDAFLRGWWQKRPLLIRGAFPGFTSPITPADLIRLAGRDGIASRLVVQGKGSRSWSVRYGPFTRGALARLPARRWTLLVHEVDQVVPEVGALLEPFRFVPNWRLDDVMVSAAAPGGGVGPHVDDYDVFLLQGMGRRRWRVASRPVREARGVPGLDLHILREFAPDRDWILEPGDMLYLPPRLAHEGVALDAGMTFSIGFRAPSPRLLLAAAAADAIERADPWRGAELLRDPELRTTPHAGEIAPAVTRVLQRRMIALLEDRRSLAGILGRAMTEPTREHATPDQPMTAAALRAHLRADGSLRRVSPARLAYVGGPGRRPRLFAGGEEIPLPRGGLALARLLTGRQRLDAARLRPWMGRPATARVLIGLVRTGWLAPDQPRRQTARIDLPAR